MPGGRPTKMTPDTIQKLEEAFAFGCTDLEACLYADISSSLFYDYQAKHPEFLDRKNQLKENPVLKARMVLLDALDAKDITTAHKVLDRREGKKVQLSGPDGGPVQVAKVQYVIKDPEHSGS